MAFGPISAPGSVQVRLGRVDYDASGHPPWRGPVISWGQVIVDRHARTVAVAGRPVRLTSAEYRMVELLVLGRSQVVTRDDLSREALGKPYHYEDRSVDQIITSIRDKIAAACGAEFGAQALIGAHRSRGYFLRGGA